MTKEQAKQFNIEDLKSSIENKISPLCSYFADCGGCSFQDINYDQELEIKEQFLKGLIDQSALTYKNFYHIEASPEEFFYRNRIDFKCVNSNHQGVVLGYTSKSTRNWVVPIDKCVIARAEINDYIKELNVGVKEKITDKYRQANIVVRTGEEGKVHWGGIGKRSTQLEEDQYFYTTINDRKIFYSLDTFFQANLSILPALFKTIESMGLVDQETTLYDLYGGVGLFTFALLDKIKKSILIEECTGSLKLAEFNKSFHKAENVDVISAKVEDALDHIKQGDESRRLLMVDPPRAGLSDDVCKYLASLRGAEHMLYLSCYPLSLLRDLKILTDGCWEIESIKPFDFFPKTRHVETLVYLKEKRG